MLNAMKKGDISEKGKPCDGAEEVIEKKVGGIMKRKVGTGIKM